MNTNSFCSVCGQNMQTKVLYPHCLGDGEVECPHNLPRMVFGARPLSSITDDEATELAKIHKYDVPGDVGVKEELISIYTKADEPVVFGNYLSESHYLEGAVWLRKKGFNV